MKKALIALALLLPVMGASLPVSAQTAGQSVMGFLLMPGDTYNGYTCPSSNIGPCFVQYGDTIPTSGGGGGTTDVNITEVGGNAVTTTVPVSGTVTVANPVGITPTDRTITSASGASEQIMAANSSRHSLTVQNTGTANCGVNPTGGTAAIGGAGTLTLIPGGSYSPRIPTLSAVTVICTAAQPIYANEN